MTSTPSQTLADFAAALSYDALPADVVDRAKLCMLDGLGCALFAAALPWSEIVARYVADVGGRAEATLWGLPQHGRVPAAAAALVNGTLVHGFELDDLHKTSILHPTSAALPAALAIAEARGADAVSGRDLVTAYVAGAEVAIRAGMAVGTTQLTAGFHPTGTLGPIAGAGAAGRMLGLSGSHMLHALGLGATQAAGLMSAQFESMVKRMHAGRAAQSGVMAAELAERGLTAMLTPFENDYGGFCHTYGGPDADLAILTRGLGERYEMIDTGFKSYSACGSTHTSIEAVKTLRREHNLTADDVAAIAIEATTATYLHVGWPYAPDSITRAQMNMRYATAVTLLDGEAFVDQYTESRIRDPRVLAIADKVDVKAAPDLDALGRDGRHAVRFTVATKDGRRLSQTQMHAKGSPAHPLTREEVVAKFHRLAGSRLGAAGADALYDCVMTLERAPSLSTLVRLVGG